MATLPTPVQLYCIHNLTGADRNLRFSVEVSLSSMNSDETTLDAASDEVGEML